MNLLQHPIEEKSLLETLLPHRDPMIMVGRLVFLDDNTCVSEFKIEKSNIFLDDGSFSEAGLIENMAQTAALDFGYRAVKNGEKPQIGYIAAIKKITILKLPNLGDVISTKLTTDFLSQNLRKISLITKLGNEVIATSEMTTVLQAEKT